MGQEWGGGEWPASNLAVLLGTEFMPDLQSGACVRAWGLGLVWLEAGARAGLREAGQVVGSRSARLHENVQMPRSVLLPQPLG